MTRLSFNTWNHSAQWGLAPSLPAQILAAGEAGYDLIGLDMPSLVAHEAAGLAPRAVRELLEDSGIACYELIPLSISEDEAAVSAALEETVRLAVEVGASQVLAVVRSGIDDRTVANTRRCARALAAVGVGLSVEFLPKLEIDSIAAARRLLGEVDHPELRIVVDSWHFFAGPSTWADLEALPLEQLGFVQFSDAVEPIGDDVVHEYRHRRVLPGEGVHDLTRFSRTLLDRSRDLTVSVEVLSEPWRRRPPAELVGASWAATRAFWPAAP